MTKEFRSYLFSQLEKKSQSPKNTAQILADELGISLSSAYKKINGDAKITLEEAFTLANKFGISLDLALSQQGDQVLFRYPSLDGEVMSPWRFLDQLIGMLTMLLASPGLKIRHTTCEIPLFHYMYYPELTAVKFYFYSNSVWNLLGNERPGQIWIDELLSNPAFQEKCWRIFDMVAVTPTEEYYQVNMFDTTLRQIHFLRETGQVSESFAATLFKQLLEMATMISCWASEGKKQCSNGQPGASYDLHVNELVYTNIMFLIENQSGRSLFSTLDSPNFTVCQDERVLERMETWFNRLKNKSAQISGQNEKHRQVFLQEVQRRVYECQKKIVL